MCQDLIGWKAPVRAHQASTPPKQQRPSDLSMQPDQDMQPANDGDVDSISSLFLAEQCHLACKLLNI